MKTTFREQLILLFVDHLLKKEDVRTVTVQEIGFIIEKVDRVLNKDKQIREADDNILSKPISYLLLPTHALNILEAEGVETIGKLIEYKKEDLLKLRGFGGKALVETKDALSEYCLELKQ